MIFSCLSQYSSFFTQYQILDALCPKSGGVLGNLLKNASNRSFRTFSEYDVDLTWGLYGAGKMMGIPLVDHIITYKLYLRRQRTAVCQGVIYGELLEVLEGL